MIQFKLYNWLFAFFVLELENMETKVRGSSFNLGTHTFDWNGWTLNFGDVKIWFIFIFSSIWPTGNDGCIIFFFWVQKWIHWSQKLGKTFKIRWIWLCITLDIAIWSSISIIPLRYLNIRFITFQCSLLGLPTHLLTTLTAFTRPDLVHIVTYMRLLTTLA